MKGELCFATPAEWNQWLRDNHARTSEVWITYWKKGSGVASINWQEAVVEALCWGWIDGIRKSVDDRRFTQRFTPRRNGSIWSRINRDHAERLMAEGRMQAPGRAAVDAARANGQWERAYAGGMAATTVPAELAVLIAADPELSRAWEGLDARNRYAFCHRLITVRTDRTRQEKAARFAAMLRAGERFYP